MCAHILFSKTEGQNSNVKMFLLLYLMLAFIEFSGYEAYFWFFVGMFYARQQVRQQRVAAENREHARARRELIRSKAPLPRPEVAHAQ
jgi:hypothetical protein